MGKGRGTGTRAPGERTSDRGQCELPASRAFVVQLPAGDVQEEPVFGRVEHVMSGRSTRFTGLEQLAEFFAEVLAAESESASEADGD